MILNLTANEITQFRYILPIQGSLQTLDFVQNILDKIKIDDLDENKDIDFEKEEIDFLIQMIKFLDQEQKLMFESLSLIHKILKQEKN